MLVLLQGFTLVFHFYPEYVTKPIDYTYFQAKQVDGQKNSQRTQVLILLSLFCLLRK